MLPEGWARLGFGALAKVESGFAFKSADFSDDQSGVPIVRMSNLKSGVVDLAEAKYVPESLLNGLDRFALKEGDFLFGMSGSIDNYATVRSEDVPCYLNQRVGRIAPKKSDPKFLQYVFTSENFKREIRLLSAGAAQLNISPKQIESIEVLTPPLPEQRRIAEILGSVDAAIEATKAVIEQTKTVKQGLLQTLLTRGIGHTEFKDSPLGEIPQSWEVKPLGEVLTLQRGIDLPVQSRRSGEVPIYGSNGIVGYHNSAPFNGIGVITGRSGTIGTVFVSEVPYHPLNTTLHVVEFFGNSPRFCSFLLEFVDLKQFVAATGVPTLNRNFVHPHQVALPPIDEQEVIANTLMDVGEQIEQEERVLASLKTLKKGLMDDLLTGKVRVNLPEKVAA